MWVAAAWGQGHGRQRRGRQRRRWQHRRGRHHQPGILRPWPRQSRLRAGRRVRQRLPERELRQVLHGRLLRDLRHRCVRYQDLHLSESGLPLLQLLLRSPGEFSSRFGWGTLQPAGLREHGRPPDRSGRLDLPARPALPVGQYRLLHRRVHSGVGARLHLPRGRTDALRERQPLVREQQRPDSVDALAAVPSVVHSPMQSRRRTAKLSGPPVDGSVFIGL